LKTSIVETIIKDREPQFSMGSEPIKGFLAKSSMSGTSNAEKPSSDAQLVLPVLVWFSLSTAAPVVTELELDDIFEKSKS
jgi:hypothetical protein